MNVKLSCLALAMSQCYASSSFDNQKPLYGPRLNISANYQNKSQSFGYFDAFLPFSTNNQNIWFADVRFLNRNQGKSRGNLGLGHRHLLNTHPWVAGAYGFFDRQVSQDNNYFSALTLGGELKAVDWSIGANVYVPVGKTVKSDPYAYNQALMPTSTANIYNIYYNQGKEAALTGVDIEASHVIAPIPGLTTYVGAYGYPSAHGVNKRVGPMLRGEYNLSDSGLLGEHPLMDSTVIEGFMCHDGFAGTNYYVGLKFSLNLDGTPRSKMNPLQRRMVDPVWKDLDVLSATDAKKTPILDVKANGTPVTVAVATNLADLNQYLSQGIDVVGVNGTINTTPNTFTNAAPLTVAPQSPVLSLSNNQTLTGGRYEYLPGRKITIASNGALTSSTNDQALLGIAKNNTIEDLSFTMTGSTSGYRKANVALSNSGASVGGLTINHNNFNNSGIDLNINDGSQDNTFSINDNTLTLLKQGNVSSTTGVDLKIEALSLSTTNQSSIRIENLDGNLINLDVSISAPVATSFIKGININVDNATNNTSTMILNSMQNNTINLSSKIPKALEYNSSSRAVSIAVKGTSTVSHIRNNQIKVDTNITPLITQGFIDDENKGLYIHSRNLTLQDVVYNSVNLNTTNGQNVALEVNGGANLNLDGIAHNNLIINNLDTYTISQSIGVYIYPGNVPNVTMSVSNINNN